MLTDTKPNPAPLVVEPYPPRYWWLKRITAGSVVLLLLLLLVRLIWGWDANRRLRNEINAIHARGEPILPEDFVTPHVPDAENFAFYLEQAIAALNPAAE